MLKILIVDDERIILNGIRALIEKKLTLPFPVSIETAAGAEPALGILRSFTPDLILTDIRMPGMDGFAFIEKLQAEGMACDIAILTSHADFSYAKRAISFHVEDFILKPIETEELEKVILRCHEKVEDYRKQDEKDAMSLLRSLLLYDLPADQLSVSEEFIWQLFPYEYFTVVLIECDSAPDDYSSYLKEELLAFYLSCRTFYFHQKKQYITICNHPVFFIETAALKQRIRHVLLNHQYNLSISLSSKSWKELHTLYSNAQLRIFYQKMYQEKEALANISFITYNDCIRILSEHDEDRIGNMLLQYLDKIIMQYPQTPPLMTEIYKSFIQNCNLYLEPLGSELLHDNLTDRALQSKEQLWNLLRETIHTFRQTQYNAADLANEPTAASILISYIDQHYMKDISLEDLAAAVNMVPNYVCTLFKKHFGRSYLNYLHQKRIDATKALLSSSESHTLSQIATLVGYNSTNQLLRIFKKYENITPGEYKKQRKTDGRQMDNHEKQL